MKSVRAKVGILVAGGMLVLMGAMPFAFAESGGIIGHLVGGNSGRIPQLALNDQSVTNEFEAITNLTAGVVYWKTPTSATNMLDNKVIKQVLLYGYDDATNMISWVTMEASAPDVSNDSKDGKLVVKLYAADTETSILTIDASGVTVVGDVAGTTIGGITQANLVDKTAVETISGVWTHTALPNLTNGVSGTYTNATGETLTVSNGCVTGGTGLH